MVPIKVFEAKGHIQN